MFPFLSATVTASAVSALPFASVTTKRSVSAIRLSPSVRVAAATPEKSARPAAISVARSSKPEASFASTRMTVSESSCTRTASPTSVTTDVSAPQTGKSKSSAAMRPSAVICKDCFKAIPPFGQNLAVLSLLCTSQARFAIIPILIFLKIIWAIFGLYLVFSQKY